MSSIEIKRVGITELDTDCIVNAANSRLMEGSGVCGAIFAAAGRKELARACNAIGFCRTGDAVITPGFALKAKYIVHAVGPIYREGNEGESEALYSCYKASLDLAMEKGCSSAGFPLISAGIFGYPKKEAWEIALKSCADWRASHPDFDMKIIFAVLDQKIMDLGHDALKQLG